MLYGSIDGMVHGQWRVIHDSGELGAAVSSYDITGLDGDTDKKYMLITRTVNDYAGGSAISMQLNSDSTTYGQQQIRGDNSTPSANRETANTSHGLGNSSAQNDLAMTYTLIDAESGKERIMNSTISERVTGTTVGRIIQRCGVFNDTATNITSINLDANQTSGIGVGSRFILLKLVDASDGMKYGDMTVNGSLEGCWERIYSNTISTAATSDTASSLDGDNDVIYLINQRFIGVATDSIAYYRPNNDSGTNYGRQYLRGQSTTASAGRGTSQTYIDTALSNHLGTESCLASTLIYAKSGYERLAITQAATNIAGTTVDQALLFGNSWNNTADNITSIVNASNDTSGLGVDTYWEIYRLNL